MAGRDKESEGKRKRDSWTLVVCYGSNKAAGQQGVLAQPIGP